VYLPLEGNSEKEEKEDMADEVDLYDNKGKKLASGVPIQNISPLRNAAIKKIVNLTIRTGAVDLAGLEKKFATGAIAGRGMVIRGVEKKTR